MNKLSHLPLYQIQNLTQWHYYVIGLFILVLSFLFYKVFLKRITIKRHLSLKEKFKSTLQYLVSASLLKVTELVCGSLFVISEDHALFNLFAFITLVISLVTLVKVLQILVYLYLFFVNMSAGVPRLIANMFTFFFSIILINIVATRIFDLHLSALLATSAVFSLVLGLALQDTLGNLFSGISLQIESPFHLGDWIEVHSKDQKWLGQVQEINWRATFLISFSDELIMIPNKTIAQSEIMIIAHGNKNIRLNQAFRFNYDVDIENVKDLILAATKKVEGLMHEPPVRILITETHDSYFVLKVFYSIIDYSLRYRIGDRILSEVILELNKAGIKFQSQKMEIVKEDKPHVKGESF